MDLGGTVTVTLLLPEGGIVYVTAAGAGRLKEDWDRVFVRGIVDG